MERRRSQARGSKWTAGEAKLSAGEPKWTAGGAKRSAGEPKWNAGETKCIAGGSFFGKIRILYGSFLCFIGNISQCTQKIRQTIKSSGLVTFGKDDLKNSQNRIF